MAEPAKKPWTIAEFFAWQERQADRYELVDGFPLRMMAGTKNVHDDIVVNLLGELRNQLRGSGCRPFTGDGSVETLPGQIRRPDAGVDCGRRDPNGYSAAGVRFVAEVLSPSTRDLDTLGKLSEYKGVESLTTILIVEPNVPEIVVWRRDRTKNWTQHLVEGLDETIVVEDIGLSLTLRDIYDGVEFPERPRLVGLKDRR